MQIQMCIYLKNKYRSNEISWVQVGQIKLYEVQVGCQGGWIPIIPLHVSNTNINTNTNNNKTNTNINTNSRTNARTNTNMNTDRSQLGASGRANGGCEVH